MTSQATNGSYATLYKFSPMAAQHLSNWKDFGAKEVWDTNTNDTSLLLQMRIALQRGSMVANLPLHFDRGQSSTRCCGINFVHRIDVRTSPQKPRSAIYSAGLYHSIQMRKKINPRFEERNLW
ncbi:hypothetical protein FF2_008179 [Malus domestica]